MPETSYEVLRRMNPGLTERTTDAEINARWRYHACEGRTWIDLALRMRAIDRAVRDAMCAAQLEATNA